MQSIFLAEMPKAVKRVVIYPAKISKAVKQVVTEAEEYNMVVLNTHYYSGLCPYPNVLSQVKSCLDCPLDCCEEEGPADARETR